MKKQLAMSALALMAASSMAFAEPPDKGGGANGEGPGAMNRDAGPSGGGRDRPDAGPAGAGQSAKPDAPGQTKVDKSARDEAPGQVKDGKSARDEAPGQKMKDDRAEQRGEKSGDRDRADREDAKPRDGASTGKSEGASGKDQPGKGSVAEMPAETKTKVRGAFAKHRVEPARNLDVAVKVGVIIPRTVSLYVVPEDVVVIYPEYRRYKYFLIDDRICVVDPATFEIVDVIVLA